MMQSEMCCFGEGSPCQNGLKLRTRLEALHLEQSRATVYELKAAREIRRPNACGLWHGEH